jgi:glycosyltransferase involved in cell wall biosynthesis
MFKDRDASRRQHSRQRRRFDATVRRADLVIAGNSYLRQEALRSNGRVELLPTPLDLERYRQRPPSTGSGVVLGWIGSRGTLRYLQHLAPVLEEVGRLFPGVRLKIVADVFLDLEAMPVEKKPWSADDEIADLHSFDIGLMPLADDAWTRGKCGFKLLQCMAVGLPVVCTPIGINAEIVTDGSEGFWATDHATWVRRLGELIADAELRLSMGQRARQKVASSYSLAVTAPLLLRYLQEA